MTAPAFRTHTDLREDLARFDLGVGEMARVHAAGPWRHSFAALI